MTAVRQDAWSTEDDLILAEVTLRHIREGSTQLAAFEEVGEKIGRTSAACGFRWNSCVRKSMSLPSVTPRHNGKNAVISESSRLCWDRRLQLYLHWIPKNICTNQMGSRTIHYQWMR